MESKKFNQYKDMLMIAFCVITLDILLKNYFTTVYGETGNGLIIFDVLISILSIFIGKRVAKAVGFPTWLVKYESNIRRQILIAILIGTVMVISNTLIWNNSDVDTITWASFANLSQPILISIRAALTEELFFRLFLFSSVVFLVSKITKSPKAPIIIGALLSSIAFGLYHEGFYLAFLYGVSLCYVYKHNGLAIAMFIHFLSDAIPFIMIYMK